MEINGLHGMWLEPYFTTIGEDLYISADQASRFAKEVAGDHNPIHDPDARRFCVPGDLLFALVLDRFGLSQSMSFAFHAMVGDQTPLCFLADEQGHVAVADRAGKVYLEVARSGRTVRDPAMVESFARRYVSFSGHNFPHYLHPLMQANGVMFHPQRPLVIYDRMEFSLDSLAPGEYGLQFDGSTMEVDGKRAVVRLAFSVTHGDRAVGHGSKKLIVSGLRPYDEQVMDGVVSEFLRLKEAYHAELRPV